MSESGQCPACGLSLDNHNQLGIARCLAEAREAERLSKTCDQCIAVMINGVYCHEHGCQNAS